MCRRQMIHFELNTASMWDKNWGFMKDIYSDMNATSSTSPATNLPNQKSSLPPIKGAEKAETPLKVTPYPIKRNYMQEQVAADYLITYNTDIIRNKYSLEEKYKFPCTTSNEVGWKWHHMKLEKFGSHAKGKRNISRWWAGALESMP